MLVATVAGCGPPRVANPPTQVPSASVPAFDTCVLGTWTVTRATSLEIVDGDVVEFTNDGGAVWRFNPDGTGEYDFGRGTTYAVNHEGDRITMVYRDKVTFSFTTEPVGRQLVLANRRSAEGGAEVSIRGKSIRVHLGLGPDSLSFRCGDGSLELIDEVTTVVLRRT
jgi:hypothetical protein